ncbi:MAG: Stp1/IreP family PP2C-type Ser/Thr phosphatase [Clostridia bacterium]|nr:Stp1/IreP family PP2C-type Ser/Thr phosphatase [Clostridia bacterium]MBP3559053.1 Stp1/IreP family PP2C-type Ser/Thr phosphatase [Clostridia bacterium]
MNVYAKTDIGKTRETNQDAFDTGYFNDGTVWAVVCDGMGGVSGGQVASSLCIDKTVNAIKRSYREDMTVNNVKNMLVSAINAANSYVFDESLKDRELKGMGTTIVAVVIVNNIAVVAHVGDSRAYIVNDTIKQITKDHSYVQLLVDNGKITLEEAENHPDKNIITRAIGIEGFVDVDVDIVDIKEEDILLLCTDGLNGYVRDDDILKTVKEYGDSSTEKLVETANLNGGHDNITVVLISSDNQGE